MVHLSRNQVGITTYADVPSPEAIYEMCKYAKYVEVDTETDKRGKMYTLQLGTRDASGEKHQFVIERGSYPIKELAVIFSDSGILKILQNAKFDHQVLNEYGFRMFPVFDTFIAEALITNGYKSRRLGLDAITAKYCGVMLDKSVRGKITYQGLTDEVVEYAAKDVEFLYDIYKQQERILTQKNIIHHCFVECQDTLAYAEMEQNGILFDVNAWKKLYAENKNKLNETENDLNLVYLKETDKRINIQVALFGVKSKAVTGINWNSPRQVVQRFRESGITLSSSQEAEVAKHNKTELAKTYLKYKDLQTQTSKFGSDYLKNIKDGRLYFNLWQCLDTMRVAIKEPNVSQIPKDNRYRNCFLADPGWVFVDHDYSSQELALIAADSKDAVWLDAINNNYDLHSVAAELVFKDRWREGAESDCAYYMENKQKCNCKEHKVMRTNVKTVNYGLA